MGIYFGITKTNTADRDDYSTDDIQTLSKYSYYPSKLGSVEQGDDNWNKLSVLGQLKSYEAYLERMLWKVLTEEEESREIIYESLGLTETWFYDDHEETYDRFDGVYNNILEDLDTVRTAKKTIRKWKREGIHFHSFMG